MPDDDDEEFGPAVRRRQLARELHGLRTAAGLKTIKAAAERTGLSTATISRTESGKQKISEDTVRAMCQGYGVGQPMIDHLVRLALESDDRGWLVEYAGTVPDWFARFVGEEQDATAIHEYESELVPGLLQIEEYTDAVRKASSPYVSETDRQRSVSFRQRRQARLAGEQPPHFTAYINEAVVRRTVGSERIMHDQIRYLIKVAERPNITLRVVPFSAGAHPAMTSSFTMLEFPKGGGTPTIFVEVYRGALYPDGPDDRDFFGWVLDQLDELALSAENTIDLLSRLVPGSMTPGN